MSSSTSAAITRVSSDGTVFSGTPADGGTPGVLAVDYAVCLAAAYTLASQTTSQKFFNGSANGAVTLPVGTYFFEWQGWLTAMSAVSGNALLDVLGAGTATTGTWLWSTAANEQTAAQTTGNGVFSVQITSATGITIATAATGTGLWFRAFGTFRVTVAGTVIPSITLKDLATPSVAAGSYFRCYSVGGAAFATVGPWS